MHKPLKIILKEILWNIQGDFWKNFQRITETSNNFIEKLQRNSKEILEIFGALSKICPLRFKAFSCTENTANIFQNNILLVNPLTIILHGNDVSFTFGVFAACLYKKHNINKYRYFQKNIDNYQYEKMFDIPIIMPEVANHIFLWRHFYLHPPHRRCVFTPIMHTLVT